MNATAERVLIVDDDENILFLLARALERSGYQVVALADSQQALEKLQTDGPFSVLLTDLMMPGLSGMDLLQYARQLDPFLEIVVITAAGSIESAISVLRDGKAWDYLLKPLDSLQQVTAVINRAVAHRRLARERAALQAQVEAEAERLRALVASVGEAILAASSGGQITVANPAAQRLLGQKELVGSQVEAALPSRLMDLIKNWRVIGSQYPASLEISWNANMTLMISLAPLPESGGKAGWVMALRDITLLKEQEKLKTQALSEVIGRIRILLAEAMNALVEINLRAPQDERTASSLFRLTRVWENIQTWGDELIAVAQADTVRAPQPKTVNLDQLLKALGEGTSLRRQSGGNRLTLEIADSLPPIQTDPEILSGALQSLLRRAALRNPPDGVIQVRALTHNQQVWIAISDQGPAAEDTNPLRVMDQSMKRLATDEIRSDPAALPAHLGLELMRARSMVERLEGQLWIGGQGPRGSTILLCLPLALTLSVRR